jgi:glycosyltransferase involved in cell wall biosynthesis
MSYLINPAGRMVAIDDPLEYNRWAMTPGFSKPTVEQEQEYIKSRIAMVSQMTKNTEPDKGIYMATVSQGGKDGYSISSNKLINELRKLGVIINTYNQGQKIALLFHNPYSVLRLEAPYRIIYTMFESDKIPDDWKDYLDAADKVLVPSHWCQNIFKQSGCSSEVLPLGYDDSIYTYQERKNKRETHEPFTFLHYNAFNIRKGFPEVFNAFVKEFDKAEPVKMIFKTTLDNPPLPITKKEYPNIEIITGKWTEAEMAKLCGQSDCFVFPSRGEGFGITPLEAMATGLPAIVPNAHGVTEYFSSRYMYEVKVKEECPALYSRYKNQDVGKMVICDVDDLAKKMRWVYEHQIEAREMGKAASEYVKQWTFSKTAIKLKEIFDEILSKPLPDRKLRNVLSLEKV